MNTIIIYRLNCSSDPHFGQGYYFCFWFLLPVSTWYSDIVAINSLPTNVKTFFGNLKIFVKTFVLNMLFKKRNRICWWKVVHVTGSLNANPLTTRWQGLVNILLVRGRKENTLLSILYLCFVYPYEVGQVDYMN